MQIGRKIYYEKATGNVILETGERMGDVVETTTEQDFAMYTALQQYVPGQVGVVRLEYGQDSEKFGMYHYSVDTTTGTLVWGTPINYETPTPGPTLEDQLNELKEQNLVLMDAIATLYETMLTGGTL
jgi:hypothetical protein